MHRIVPVVLVVCLACGVPNAPAGRTTDVDAVTRAKVETWRRLYQQQDADGLRRLLADDFIVIDDEGTVSTKDAEVAWLAKNESARAHSRSARRLLTRLTIEACTERQQARPNRAFFTATVGGSVSVARVRDAVRDMLHPSCVAYQ